MLKSITHTCLISTAHVSHHDSHGKKQVNIKSYSVTVTGSSTGIVSFGQSSVITASKAKAHSLQNRLFSSIMTRSLEAPSLSLCPCWTGSLWVLRPRGTVVETWMTLAAGTRAVSFHHRMPGTKASLVITCVFSIAFQSCGKERTASDRCQTNLLQLTCAANVEPSDPDLDGNHCKYFPARLVEDSFNRASRWGIKLTVNDSNCVHFVSSVPKQQ